MKEGTMSNGNGNGNGSLQKTNGNKQNGFNSVFDSLMTGAQGVLTSKTVVGEPISIGDTIIIPLSDVSRQSCMPIFWKNSTADVR